MQRLLHAPTMSPNCQPAPREASTRSAMERANTQQHSSAVPDTNSIKER